jgi:hypothetical protein
MQLPVYIYRRHCCNKEAVSVGTHLNFCYSHDSFFPFLFLFSLFAGGRPLLRLHMSVSMFIFYFGIKKRNSNSENKSKAATMKY